MKKGRTIFIGDIHGCYKEFKLLLKKINLIDEDKVYLTGDLIAKGPKSFKVLKFLYKNKDQFKAVKGNSEINFLNWLNEDLDKKRVGEYQDIFQKLNNKLKENPEILDYLKEIPLYIDNNDFLLIHGGLIPGKSLEEHSIDELVRTREHNNKPWYEYYTGDKKVIYGHWGVDSLRIRKNTIGLDTGCVYGKHLTAYVLETGEITQQSALDIYVNVYNTGK